MQTERKRQTDREREMNPLDAVITSGALVQGVHATCSCGIRTSADLEVVRERLVSMAVPPPERFMYAGGVNDGDGADAAAGSSGREGRWHLSAEDATALHAMRKCVWIFRPAAATGVGRSGGGRLLLPQRMSPELRVAMSVARPTASVDVEYATIARGSTVPKDMQVPSNMSFRQFSYGSIMLPSAVTLDADAAASASAHDDDADARIPTSIASLLRIFESMGYILDRAIVRDTFVVDVQRDSNARLAVNLISTSPLKMKDNDDGDDGNSSDEATLDHVHGTKDIGIQKHGQYHVDGTRYDLPGTNCII